MNLEPAKQIRLKGYKNKFKKKKKMREKKKINVNALQSKAGKTGNQG